MMFSFSSNEFSYDKNTANTFLLTIRSILVPMIHCRYSKRDSNPDLVNLYGESETPVNFQSLDKSYIERNVGRYSAKLKC